MPVYTVHAPVANGADLAAADKFVFVRDGFHFWAAVASVIGSVDLVSLWHGSSCWTLVPSVCRMAATPVAPADFHRS